MRPHFFFTHLIELTHEIVCSWIFCMGKFRMTEILGADARARVLHVRMRALLRPDCVRQLCRLRLLGACVAPMP